MTPCTVRRFAKLDSESEKLTENVIARIGLSVPAYDRILRVSRSIAGLEGTDNIQARHVAEAIPYPTPNRTCWQ